MSNSIVQHWRKLSGAVHPDDEAVFKTFTHNFNLDYPPPAYVGDIENAPVVLLESYGGYSVDETPAEFAQLGAVDRFLDWLHNPRQVDPETVAPYYGRRNYASLIASGSLSLVNAVAYRTPDLHAEPTNKKLVEQLPSTSVHRDWLRSELLKQASQGDRLVIAHRNGLWKLKSSEAPLRGVIFTTNHISSDLSYETLDEIESWLSKDVKP